MQIKFSVNGDVQLSRNLRLLASKIENINEFFSDAIEVVENRTDEIFKNKGSNVEKAPKWKPLKPSTLKARSSRSGYYKRPPNNPSTLRWTGNLQNSRKKTVNNRFGLLEFTAKYAGFHQEGGKNLPKRAIIDLSNNTNEKIVKKLQEKINRDIRIFGLQA